MKVTASDYRLSSHYSKTLHQHISCGLQQQQFSISIEISSSLSPPNQITNDKPLQRPSAYQTIATLKGSQWQRFLPANKPKPPAVNTSPPHSVRGLWTPLRHSSVAAQRISAPDLRDAGTPLPFLSQHHCTHDSVRDIPSTGGLQLQSNYTEPLYTPSILTQM